MVHICRANEIKSLWCSKGRYDGQSESTAAIVGADESNEFCDANKGDGRGIEAIESAGSW